jgi:hypothetical protein
VKRVANVTTSLKRALMPFLERTARIQFQFRARGRIPQSGIRGVRDAGNVRAPSAGPYYCTRSPRRGATCEPTCTISRRE